MIFDIIPKFLASIASFLFPLFASYKALKTSDPAQLTPWLMYWSVLSCALLVESWVEFVLVWVPFYAYMRLFFLLYLVLPQTQGARHLYETYLHPYLEDNETAIEDFIASAHDRLKAAGMTYLKQAIEYLKTKVLNMPPSETEREDETRAAAAPQGYTQSLLARFSVPAARWATANAGTAGNDFYNLLAGAVGAATGSRSSSGAGGGGGGGDHLIPENIRGSEEKMSFIAAQRERLALVLSMLDREAQQLQKTEEERRGAEQARKEGRAGSMSLDGQDASRPPSGHSMWSAISKSRSEVDFEKIDAVSGAESGAEDDDDQITLRRRTQPAAATPPAKAPWTFLGWGISGSGPTAPASGKSSGVEQ